jgi:hypothetical protein
MVKPKASFQSAEPDMTGGTIRGMLAPPPSKFWKPPMPTRLIHSKSDLIPDLVTLAFIQCHQTRGLAL